MRTRSAPIEREGQDTSCIVRVSPASEPQTGPAAARNDMKFRFRSVFNVEAGLQGELNESVERGDLLGCILLLRR